ncbi:MAG: pyridoxal phosphate-dependent aminotransferase [Acidobacteria bacterium]|nr:pyridoxal phosphate-dependent aminotransferase [Acidobacteriota bacterium]
MFSSRLPGHLTPNAFSAAITRHRLDGVRLLDLTTSNPTRVGVSYPDDLLRDLAAPAALTYSPEAFGMSSAREAVWASLPEGARAGLDPRQIILTASTSEAYSVLFKLLCSPGDEVLVPQPSYPLFDWLTRLDDVRGVPYRLERHGSWSIDRASLEQALTTRTRAVLVVSPNNPTGSRLRADDREWLVDVAVRHGLALISDEVFIDYPLEPLSDATSLLGESRVLTFTLGGLSKSVGLPQIKVGWTIASGPTAERDAALEHLEIICDTYLSVSTPAQVALPDLLKRGVTVRDQIQARLIENLAVVRAATQAEPRLTMYPPEGGWSVVLQVPATIGEEALVRQLLDLDHVIVHPGYFFDLDRGDHLVVSLLPEPPFLREALSLISLRLQQVS